MAPDRAELQLRQGRLRPESRQVRWLRRNLRANPAAASSPTGITRCSLPAPTGSSPWAVLAGAASSGADVVLNGHDHLYERFAPKDPAATDRGGIVQFTVGTGGRFDFAARKRGSRDGWASALGS